MAGARGHRGGLEDDGVTAGRQPNCHLLVQDPTWSLEVDRGSTFILIICALMFFTFWDNRDQPLIQEMKLFDLLLSKTGYLKDFLFIMFMKKLWHTS